MERILAAVDFSSCSQQALRSALELARGFRAELRVAYVDPETFDHLLPQDALEPRSLRTPRLERELDELILQEFKGEPADFARIDRKILVGAADVELLREAGEWNASLLVAGTHGRSALGRLFLGSVSNRLFHLAGVPVLIVPPEAAVRPRKILAAVDGREATASVLRTAALWRDVFGAEVTVLHALDQLPEPVLMRLYPEAELRPQMQRLLQRLEAEIREAVEQAFPEAPRPAVEFPVGPPAAEICRSAAEGGYDLVLVGAHERHGVLNLGNNAARVAHRCPCSVLVARRPASPGAGALVPRSSNPAA